MGIIRINYPDNIDDTDIEIINLLIDNQGTRQIADTLDRPQSTIQRRVKSIQQKGILAFIPQLDYSKMGLKRGLLHISLQNRNLRDVAEKFSNYDGAASVSVYLGNSDIVIDFVFNDTAEVLKLIENIKRDERVNKVVWAEEVYKSSRNVMLMPVDGRMGETSSS